MNTLLGELRNDSDGSFQPGEDCEGCDGSGVRIPAEPSCLLPVLPEDWCVVERCDCCEKYSNDLAAGLAFSKNGEWVKCAAGGWHAIVCYPLHSSEALSLLRS